MAHRILIIDDEEDIRTVAAMALDMNSDLDVRTCGSGSEGQKIAEWWQPHLILLDVRMPGLTGPETLADIRSSERTASIPIIFFTASVQKHEKDDLMALGAQGIIEKPFDPMVLAARIACHLPASGDRSESAVLALRGVNQEEAIKSLLYVSQSRLSPSEFEVEVSRIVATARSRNKSAGITGALIFTQTHFAQYLEGPEAAVDELMEKLRQDPRHSHCQVVRTPEFTRRRFSDWSMAYGGASTYVANLVMGTLENGQNGLHSGKLIRLMREFTNDVSSAA